MGICDWAADRESMSRLVVETFNNMALLDPVFSFTFAIFLLLHHPGHPTFLLHSTNKKTPYSIIV